MFYFQKMWPAIDLALKQKLGAEYDADMKSAWNCVFSFIIRHMSSGMTTGSPRLLSKRLNGLSDRHSNSSSEVDIQTKVAQEDL